MMDEGTPLLGDALNQAGKKDRSCFSGLGRKLKNTIFGLINLIPFGFAYNGTFAGNFVLFPNPQSKGIQYIPAQNWVLLLSCIAIAVANPVLGEYSKAWGEKYKEIDKNSDVLERVRLIFLLLKENPEKFKVEMNEIMEKGELASLKKFIDDFVEQEYDKDAGNLDVGKFISVLLDATGASLGTYVYFLLLTVLAVDVSMLGDAGAAVMRYAFPVLVAGIFGIILKGNYDDMTSTRETAISNLSSIGITMEKMELPQGAVEGLSEQISEIINKLSQFQERHTVENKDDFGIQTSY